MRDAVILRTQPPKDAIFFFSIAALLRVARTAKSQKLVAAQKGDGGLRK